MLQVPELIDNNFVKVLPIFYGTRRYVATYMKDVCWSVSWCRLIWIVNNLSLSQSLLLADQWKWLTLKHARWKH